MDEVSGSEVEDGRNVTAFESYLPMGKLMRKVLKENAMEKKIRIVHKRSDEVEMGVDIHSPAYVMVRPSHWFSTFLTFSLVSSYSLFILSHIEGSYLDLNVHYLIKRPLRIQEFWRFHPSRLSTTNFLYAYKQRPLIHVIHFFFNKSL